MIPADALNSFIPVIYAFFRTELQACKAKLAFSVPDRFIFYHFNIIYRADFFTGSASVAFFINSKILVKSADFFQPWFRNKLLK
jgi:hypothetical protein